VILCYPDTPEWFHILYLITHRLGISVTNNPHRHFDIAISFEDTTTKREDATLMHLRTTTHLINGNCMDNSKRRVEKVFEEVFGYSLAIDPRTHQGICLRKSDRNATHDGTPVFCPAPKEAGYVYEKFINNRYDESSVQDIRVAVYNGTIPFIVRKYKKLEVRFETTHLRTIGRAEDMFSEDEIALLLSFAKHFGLDYGELDVLRDVDNGKIYVVDVNLTCSGPVIDEHVSPETYHNIVASHMSSFTSYILNAHRP
jgi:predicted ATP-dependent endonuclease of OLD family